MVVELEQVEALRDGEQAERLRRRVTIVRDDWGIAHIHGKTDADAVFGVKPELIVDFKKGKDGFATANLRSEKPIHLQLAAKSAQVSSAATASNAAIGASRARLIHTINAAALSGAARDGGGNGGTSQPRGIHLGNRANTSPNRPAHDRA